MRLDLKAIKHNLYLFNEQLRRIYCDECDKDIENEHDILKDFLPTHPFLTHKIGIFRNNCRVFPSLSDNPRLSVYATFPNRTIGVNLVVFRVRETLFSPVGTQCL